MLLSGYGGCAESAHLDKSWDVERTVSCSQAKLSLSCATLSAMPSKFFLLAGVIWRRNSSCKQGTESMFL